MTEAASTKSRIRARRGLRLKLSEDTSTDQLPIAQIYTSKIKTYEKMVAESQGKFEVDDDSDNDDVKDAKDKKAKKLPFKHKLKDSSLEIANETEELENPHSRSPSPPPVRKVSTEKRYTRKMKKVIKNLEANARKYLASNDENASLDEDDVICIEDDLDNREIPIKILWQGSIIRICMKMNDKFANIFPEVAKKCNANVSEILLTIKDRNITVDDTPQSLNLTVADILDCFVIKSLTGSEESTSENCINLKLQSNDSKMKTNIVVHKVEPLSTLMEKYAKMKNLPLNRLCFKFDGEVLSPSDTPIDLDMEDDSCIDVIISE